MKYTKYSILLCLVLMLFACKRNDGFVNTELGFSFKHCTTNKNTPKVKAGDVVFGQMKIMLNNKTLISSNYGKPDRLFVVDKNAKEGGIDEFLITLHIGDSALMVCPADSMAKYLKDREFKPEDKVWIYLTINQIISTEDVTEYTKEKQLRDAQEDERLTQFVLRKYDQAEQQSTGLFYINKKEGTGKKAEFGKMVAVNYTVCDTTGRIIDSNVEEVARKGNIYKENILYAPFEFMLGDDALISGWGQGISLMKEGGHAVLVIPSRLAYGDVKYRSIEPYTPLVFDVYLLKVE
ncbi:MAG: FKBP-type peptidyl-prolyl cis-trans isomerase [Bacteroidota bacterium]|nr:FKBP-type peptidyl-prolyl cis-trans isomerase [Bacteroidota bacterium]